MTQPLISVIIPAYNCERYIADTLNSIFNQTYPHFEILIADDASKDNTKDIIESFNDPRLRKFHNPVNLGYLKTCNKLFALAEGQFVAFQDADDLSEPTRFEKQIQAFEKNKELGVCGCSVFRIDANGEKFDTLYFDEDVNASLKNRTFEFVANTFLFKKEVYLCIGGYKEYFNRMGFEDYYWTALAADYFPIINLSEPLYSYRSNPASVSKSFQSDTVTFSYQSFLFLLNQRIETRKDYLQYGEEERLKAAVYLKLCGLATVEKNYRRAIKFILQSLKHDPFSMYKIKTLLYIIKKSITDPK